MSSSYKKATKDFKNIIKLNYSVQKSTEKTKTDENK